MSVDYYYSSVSSNLEIKKQQQKIEMVLESKGIEFKKLDIAADENLKKEMRRISGNPTALPPQLCNGEQYCGGYDDFVDALESEQLEEFLKLK